MTTSNITHTNKTKTAGIYRIINTKNKRYYIGSSIWIERRIKGHFRKLRKGNHENPYLQNDFNKHQNDYIWEILQTIDDENLRLLQENALLVQHHDNQNMCYNINKTAYLYGKYKSPEGLARIKESAKNTIKKLWRSSEFRKLHKEVISSSDFLAKVKKSSHESNSHFITIELYSPTNVLTTFHGNHKQIASQLGISNSNFSGLLNGRYRIVGGWSKNEKKTWKVTNENQIVQIYEYTVKTFCQKHNIGCSSHFREMLDGSRKCYKGWRLVAPELY